MHVKKRFANPLVNDLDSKSKSAERNENPKIFAQSLWL